MDPLLNKAPCGFASVMDDGTMISVNATLAGMLGYSRAELEGWHLQKILPPGGRIFYQTHVFPLLKLHGMAEEIYIALRGRDGVDLPVLMNAARRQTDAGTVNDCVFVRMIQRHQFEDQLLQARRLAEEASAAKEKFMSMMSHDLRTPLTAIMGNASLLEGGAFGVVTEEQIHSLARIREASQDLLRLLNDILGFAQTQSGTVTVNLEPVSIRAAVERAERLIRLRLEESGLTFSVDGVAGHYAMADRERLQQILLNLLTNAFKFTPPGGRVSVSTESEGDRVLIRVADTGSGIPPDQLETIFEPFVQLDEQPSDAAQRGVGLGLAISRDLARAMHGDVSAASVPGEGSVFTVSLPEATG
jgi:PAS domain S-box-containing protein